MKTATIILLTLCCYSFNAAAQKEDRVWVFQDSICINFNNISSPIVSNIAIDSHNYSGENAASISTRNGDLLFYIGTSSTDDISTEIRGQNNQVIQNGDSIITNFSQAKGSIFLPFPNDTSKYFLFYTNHIYHSYLNSKGFFYSIVDKSLNSGNGACIDRNHLVFSDTLCEEITALRHGNGADWWILVHELNSKVFYKFLLTQNGLTGPFTQTIGPYLNWIGQLTFSPNGDKLGLTDYINNRVALFNFNRCTGMLSNYKLISTDINPYGCSFSPNGKIFYASTFSKLFQFNLDSPNIAQSKLLIWYDSLINTNFSVGQHLLAPDGKIYIVRTYSIFPNNVFDTSNTNLTVIQNPDVYGIGCNIQPYSFYLNGMKCLSGLPNMVNYNLGALIGSPCDTIPQCTATQNSVSVAICEGDSLTIGGNIYTQEGIYIDTLTNAFGCDSIVTTTLEVDTMSATVTASGDTLTAIENGVSYQWYNCDSSSNILGAIAQSFVATTTGHFAVLITDGFGCGKLSDCVFVDVNGISELSGLNNYLRIYPNPALDELTVEVLNGIAPKEIEITNALGVQCLKFKVQRPTAQLNIKSLAAGVYFVKVRMKDGSVTVRKLVKE